MLVKLDKAAHYATAGVLHGLRAKADGDGPGWIEGYAAAYGNLDSQREVLRPGVFAQSIAEKVPAGKVKLMTVHARYGGDVPDLIGVVTEAREDEYGLWSHNELDGGALAQDVRRKAANGLVTGLSVGYRPIEGGWNEIVWPADGKAAVELVRAEWFETTVTCFPANERAVITAAKTLLAGAANEQLPADVVAQLREETRELGALVRQVEEMLGKRVEAAAEDGLLALQRDLDLKRRMLELEVIRFRGKPLDSGD